MSANDEYSAALVELTNALTEWKDAGADVLTVVGAVQRFIFAINNQADAAKRAGEQS